MWHSRFFVFIRVSESEQHLSCYTNVECLASGCKGVISITHIEDIADRPGMRQNRFNVHGLKGGSPHVFRVNTTSSMAKAQWMQHFAQSTQPSEPAPVGKVQSPPQQHIPSSQPVNSGQRIVLMPEASAMMPGTSVNAQWGKIYLLANPQTQAIKQVR